MSLAPGTKLGPYEVVSAIGAGGMGEVYKARDTRLGREVAIKVLPPHLSSSEEMRQRFEREAKAISQLSHAHICALYDVGSHEGTEFLVMEYLEGETLATRLLKGALPLAQTLAFGIEIADALDKAHRQGIIHRDLKPGNIMLTRAGVKLLDFGLAKAIAPASPQSGLTSLPTMATPQNLTQQGTILGTFQYMAPEQLEGAEADVRSDIFALGAVLYEMATGQKAFQGKSQASLIGSILKEEPPPVTSVAPMTPPALDRVIKTCLSKDPENRFQTAHDVKLQLQWVAEGGSQAGLPAPVLARRKNREKLAWAAAAVAALAAIGFAAAFVRRAPAKARTVRFEIPTPEEVTAIDLPRVSPNGRIIAFNATDSSGKTRIWVRPLNSLTAQPLSGTDGATRPFWSPDSRFLGFVAEGKLKKIDVSGGPPQKVCDAPTGSDGSWSPEGVILFDGAGNDPIYRVSASGGSPSVAVKASTERKETQVGWPEFLPDGKHFLYMATGQKPENTEYRVATLDSKETKTLAPAQTMITYAPPGYLLFVRDRTLVAQSFNPGSIKTTNEPVPLAERVGTNSVGLALFSVSREGTLVYRTGEAGTRMVWMDRAGKEIEAVGDPGESHNPALSPKSDRLAYDLSDSRGGRVDIWIRDLVRGVSSRFTFGAADEIAPVWSPDATRIVFSDNRSGTYDLYQKFADGQGEEKLLLHSDEDKYPSDWSRDGKYIAYVNQSKDTGFDIFILPTFGEAKPFPFVKTSFNEFWPVFSPDGRFLAYQSNESGRNEVYVQSFPGPGGKWQVSTAGGVEPKWNADGKEIVYRAPDQNLMAVEVKAADSFQAGVPKPLFAARVAPGIARNRYVAAPDDQRFLVVAPIKRESMTPTTVVLNWAAELGR
jgi:eukaryotic-like serine/threonine-protein kinase